MAAPGASRHADAVRVALLAESFLPHMNGVTNSVLQVLRQLDARGHEAMVIAPRVAGLDAAELGARLGGVDVELVPSMPLPSYPQVRVAAARVARLRDVLARFGPDVVHLASPFLLGWQGVVAADSLRLPAVAVYQTDVVAYTAHYRLPRAASLAAWRIAQLHRRATMTLVPSRAAQDQLEGMGVDRLRRWGRGVDADRFHPGKRDEAWRATVAPGERVVGYVGRLAPEKQVEDLGVLTDLPGTRLVVVGDGPQRAELQRRLPGAVFTGHLSGEELARTVASFDVFVHPGESETFCQTVQEALASGVPVVATGYGGSRDRVRSSVDGWLYRPGDLADLRDRVADLVGDAAKRAAFAAAARDGVRNRGWPVVCDQLLGHYAEARELRVLDDRMIIRPRRRPERPIVPEPAARVPWSSFVALGDSITEGMCDDSRMPAGVHVGWADRLALLLAGSRPDGLRYANLAVRSRRVEHVETEQLPRALELRPQLVSVLIGANDLVRRGADPVVLARRVELVVHRLREAGCDVLLGTPFLPALPVSRLIAGPFAEFSSELRRVAGATDALLLDLDVYPELADPSVWAQDKVHLRPRGHRILAYRAAERLGVPHARALGGLEAVLHDDDDGRPRLPGSWVRVHAVPWAWRRIRGRTAGDGLGPKHLDYVRLPGSGTVRRPAMS